jgi:acyl carrier protein
MIVYAAGEIEKTLAEITSDLVQDWGVEPEEGISGQTKLVADLEFASVDIIQLCVAIEQHYGQKMGFHALLMRNGSYVPDLSLSQIAEFLAGKINRKD